MSIIIGQEAICPDGLGRVSSIFDDGARIKITTYMHDKGTVWDADLVILIDPEPHSPSFSKRGIIANSVGKGAKKT